MRLNTPYGLILQPLIEPIFSELQGRPQERKDLDQMTEWETVKDLIYDILLWYLFVLATCRLALWSFK